MKVSRKGLILFIQLLLFMIPVGFISISIVKVIWYTGLFISIVYILLKNIGKNLFIPHTCLTWFLFYLIAQLVMTYLNKGDWLYGILSMSVLFVLILFVEKQLQSRPQNFLEILDKVLIMNICVESVLYVILNIDFLMDFACIYVYYGVWATVHLINCWMERENDYQFYTISFLLVCVTIIRPQIGSNGNANYEWTFYVMVLILSFIFLFRRFFYKWSKFINVLWFYLGVFGFNLLFVIMQVQKSSIVIKFIVEDIMHKDVSFSGRTGIWNMALSFVFRKLLIGYGTSFIGLGNSTDTWTNWLMINGPHNQFIAILLSGGIITLFFYIIYIYISTIRLLKFKKNPISVILVFGLLTIYVELSLTYRNLINCIPLFILLAIARHIDLIVGVRKNED